ncbi:MAG: Fibronectin type domain protein [bacterium]|nr:Fibronectin type domain protein [bacterium]
MLLGGCSPDSSAGDGGADGGSSDCVEPTGPGTMHGSIMQDETWTAAASPHVLAADTTFYATVTLEPCTEVRIGAGKTLTVGAGGRIVAKGTAARPVAFVRLDPAAPWAAIRALGGGTLDLEYTGLVGGGDPLNFSPPLAAVLDLRADQSMPPAEVLHADHLLVQDSASNGIYLHESGGFSAASTGVVITGSQGYPIHSWSNLAGTIPDGVYTGNGVDEILLSAIGQAEGISSWDVTFHDRGVPYHVGFETSTGTLRVGTMPKAPVATLTLEPGVVLRFKKGGDIQIEHYSGMEAASGALVAVGTATRKIRFTSAEAAPAAGDWLGLSFGSVPDPASRLDNVSVEYAGGASGSGSNSCLYPMMPINDAAIRMFGGEPTSVFITNTTISDSASHGIDRGFQSDNKPDFLLTNSFVNVAPCQQTYPRDVTGPCPTPVPCP